MFGFGAKAGSAIGKGSINPYAKSMVGGALLGMGARAAYNGMNDSSGGYMSWGMMGMGAMMARRGARLGAGAMGKLPGAGFAGKHSDKIYNGINKLDGWGSGFGDWARKGISNFDFVKKSEKLTKAFGSDGMKLGFHGAGAGIIGGAALGAAYGAVSPSQSMMGGAFKGAVLGGVGGAIAYRSGKGLSTLGKNFAPIKTPKSSSIKMPKDTSVNMNHIFRPAQSKPDPVNSMLIQRGPWYKNQPSVPKVKPGRRVQAKMNAINSQLRNAPISSEKSPIILGKGSKNRKRKM